jgi:hypothetical protein
MPIKYRIVHDQGLVAAKAHGNLTDEEVFGYRAMETTLHFAATHQQ